MSEEAAPDAAARPPRRRMPAASVLALVLAVIALLLAGYGYWSERRLARDTARRAGPVESRLSALEQTLAARTQQDQAYDHRLAVLESGLDGIRSDLHGLEQRTGNLETAFATLSGQQASAHDALLLDDAAMLLRTGQQRYELFHDADGALKAYALAIQALGQVRDPAYAPVRAAAASERDALAAAAPPSRQAALDTLSALRTQIATLPLASPAVGAPLPARASAWTRIVHAFGGIVRIERDNGAAPPVADAQFARELAALDLAQAEEALLAFDEYAYRSALRRVAATLAARFDGDDAAVRSARDRIAALLAQHAGGPPPRLGGALAQLQSLRASAALRAPAPASAASGGAGQP